MILRAIHKNDLADGANFKFLDGVTFSSGDPVPKQMSDILANLADYHIDIAKTVGIKRIKVEITFDYTEAPTQVLIFTVMENSSGAQDPFDSITLHGNVWSDPWVIGKTGSLFINTPTAWYRPGGYDTASGTQTVFPIVPYESSTSDPMTDAGLDPTTTPPPSLSDTEHHPINKTFAADEFQMVNLNFKNGPRFTYDYTYATTDDRVNAVGFTSDDIGKFATQTASGSIAGDTTWEILSINSDTTAVWAIRTSPDAKAQIAGGHLFTRPVLIFTGGDGTYSEDIFQLFPGYTSPDHDTWEDRVSYPSIPAHDAKDERLEWSDYLGAYDVYTGGYDRSQDPGSEYGPPLGNSIGSFLYTLNRFGGKALRWILQIKITNAKFKYLTAKIQNAKSRAAFDKFHWLTNYSDGFSTPLVLETPFFLYSGLIVTGFDDDNHPIVAHTDAPTTPLTPTTLQGRWTPKKPDSSDYPHDLAANPYMVYRQWTGASAHAEGSVKVTFYPD
jgi:hypothetical protein